MSFTLTKLLSVLDTVGRFSTIFDMEDKFCDFLLANSFS